jgi:hypothetical protein
MFDNFKLAVTDVANNCHLVSHETVGQHRRLVAQNIRCSLKDGFAHDQDAILFIHDVVELVQE